MILITYQNKEVLELLKTKKTYYADIKKSNYDYEKQYKKLADYCGFKETPIFCAPENNIDAIYRTFHDSIPKELVKIKLKVPKKECHIHDYFDWSDYIYFSDGQEYDKVYKFRKNQALNHIEKYLNGKINTPQIIINRIEPKWLI